jgi:hypothetical protein
MSQSNSHSALVAQLSPEVLALLAASYGKKDPKPNKPSKLALVKAAAVDAAEVEATERSTHDPRPAMVVLDLPKVGTLDARAFLIAMRGAKTRDEQIKAIAGYCGYDRHGDHGSQDLSSRMKAQRELRGIKAAPLPIHSAAPSGKGYVHGMPDMMATKVQDLLGRERLSAEALADNERIAANEETDAATRHYHAQLAIVETARLAQIRADLATMGVK